MHFPVYLILLWFHLSLWIMCNEALLGRCRILIKYTRLNNETKDPDEDCNLDIPRVRHSILDAISLEDNHLIRMPERKISDVSKVIMCSGREQSRHTSGQEMKIRIKDAIESTLRFYESHLDLLNMTDDAAGLSIVKAVDDKHGSQFQYKYPLESWTDSICSRTLHGRANCTNFGREFLRRDKIWSGWLESDVLENQPGFSNVGTDMETIHPQVNTDCIHALLERCEIPSTCESIMFDPIPRAQYMLSHQLLHRIFAKTRKESCNLPQKFVDETVNHKLCAKMLLEAELMADHGVPFIFQDLFAEHMSFCGYIGYPNFFREEWLNHILSWQSRSDYGCFLKENGSNFVTSDIDVPRRIGERERRLGVKFSDEICQTHFTSVALSALAVAWDYLEDNCWSQDQVLQ